tara:strand:+ start:662 stop:1111 length:450 start_codon:yes stop_codon:yes gene_type:complete
MEINPFTDEYFMKEALKEAKKAMLLDEVPVGAVVVCDNQIIARTHNYTEALNDVTAHAEMQAFTSAADFLGGKYLEECVLYVTLEPCVMCAGASYWTRLKKIVFGAPDEKRGFLSVNETIIHPKTEVIKGVLDNECSKLLKDFFKKKRQ